MTQRQQATVHNWSMRQLMRCEIIMYLNSLCCSFFWFCKPNWSPCPALHGVSTSDRQARNSILLTSLAAFIVISSSLDSLASSFISAQGFFLFLYTYQSPTFLSIFLTTGSNSLFHPYQMLDPRNTITLLDLTFNKLKGFQVKLESHAAKSLRCRATTLPRLLCTLQLQQLQFLLSHNCLVLSRTVQLEG